jgi:hypothetical protein
LGPILEIRGTGALQANATYERSEIRESDTPLDCQQSLVTRSRWAEMSRDGQRSEMGGRKEEGKSSKDATKPLSQANAGPRAPFPRSPPGSFTYNFRPEIALVQGWRG